MESNIKIPFSTRFVFDYDQNELYFHVVTTAAAAAAFSPYLESHLHLYMMHAVWRRFPLIVEAHLPLRLFARSARLASLIDLPARLSDAHLAASINQPGERRGIQSRVWTDCR